MSAALKFDEDRHEYAIGDNVIPNVTSILDPLVDFSMVNTETLEFAADRGRKVHKAVELYLKGTLDRESLDERIRPYLDAFILFESDTGFKVELNEARVYHPQFGYAGTLDLVGKVCGIRSLVDIKARAVMTPDTGPQTAAYNECLANKADRRYGLQLMPTGRYKLYPYFDYTDLSVFLSCLTIYKFKQQHGLLKEKQ